ncbi:hypothetical protein, partial [Klebsiella pneumoniae]|uniref:hypothetical protein n=1 Tax=Klebsiella pneumoniae TaxID=573 RepID=UPI00272F001E
SLNRMKFLKYKVVIVPDLGFIEEYNTVKDTYGSDVIVIKMQREGFDYSEDSRSDLDIPTDFVVKNLGINSLQLAAKQIVEQFNLRDE